LLSDSRHDEQDTNRDRSSDTFARAGRLRGSRLANGSIRATATVGSGMSAPLTVGPASFVRKGEFSFLGDDGLALSGTVGVARERGRHDQRARMPRGSMVS